MITKNRNIFKGGCELPFHRYDCFVNNHETEVMYIIRILRSVTT